MRLLGAHKIRKVQISPTFPANLAVTVRVAFEQEASGLSGSQRPGSFGEVLQEESNGKVINAFLMK